MKILKSLRGEETSAPLLPPKRSRCDACVANRQPCLDGCGFAKGFPPGTMSKFLAIKGQKNMDTVYKNLLLKSEAACKVYVDFLYYETCCRADNLVGGSLGKITEKDAWYGAQYADIEAKCNKLELKIANLLREKESLKNPSA
uniref:uncharacterized protein LOC122597204 n=2 Tax=Erigeron canadensis TaxID=72917 RepID=UPI001CB951AB|nr:uncharacterized protein LOC122597204 [Erigeron canadensis]XP_043625764.1 uncharacterized protein LOC122597205 [Erigeron canadensis]